MEFYNNYKEALDSDIISLLSIRQNIKLNSKIYKVFELGGFNIDNTLVAKIDSMIFNIEKNECNEFNEPNKNINTYKKLFNENLNPIKKTISELESLNLNRIIKQSYFTMLYDITEYGDDENYEYACQLDAEILFKLSERIHFNYEIIKYKYLQKSEFYHNILESNDTSFILYCIAENIKQPDYLQRIKKKCISYGVNDVLICTFFKNIIIPYSYEIQLHFLKNLNNLLTL
jgi:chorismate mutase